MKKIFAISLILLLSLVYGTVIAEQEPAKDTQSEPAASEAQESGLTVSRMVMAGSVENREPVGTAESFPASQDKVYCYVELKDITEDMNITFDWSLGEKDMGKVTQQVKKSSRWRTWSNKSINGMKGDWTVDLMNDAGDILKSASFKVE